MKRFIILLHRYLGLGAALLAITLGISGSLLVFRAELQSEISPDSRPTLATPVSYQAAYAMARLHYPHADISLRLPENSRDSIQARVRSKGQPDITLWLDPVSGRILQQQDSNAQGWGWLHELHARLLLPEGKIWVGCAGVLIILVLLSGITHWWPKNWSKAWRVRRDKGVAILVSDLHRTAGAAMLLLLLLSTLSGLVLAFNQPLRDWLTPAKQGKPGKHATIQPTGQRLPLDVLVQLVRTRLPEGRITGINISARSDKPVEIRLKMPGEMHPNGSTLVQTDPYQGKQLRIEKTETSNPWRRVSSWALVLHDGSFAGTAQRVATALTGLLLMLLGGSGVYQWLARRRKQAAVRTAGVAAGIAGP
ncbi:PepSY-associated TM helix domain-containing protein [Aquitalea sp.]|uniref:PepSY-associated TM helix domain-containing protein n=1 Tax=Aquitalea sp. TaxID=1872623 RepID=UPI0025850F82|nr:PepSY-associated TM helix domain-containing protein [Aquitalea sp.]